mmetsp:Transcript_19241/g.60104  ORF Transcript_19241/g.60104 Transcript_19241/m.60104 type:complete len:295 (+) Transcript_19241:43-927(+)
MCGLTLVFVARQFVARVGVHKSVHSPPRARPSALLAARLVVSHLPDVGAHVRPLLEPCRLGVPVRLHGRLGLPRPDAGAEVRVARLRRHESAAQQPRPQLHDLRVRGQAPRAPPLARRQEEAVRRLRPRHALGSSARGRLLSAREECSERLLHVPRLSQGGGARRGGSPPLRGRRLLRLVLRVDQPLVGCVDLRHPLRTASVRRVGVVLPRQLQIFVPHVSGGDAGPEAERLVRAAAEAAHARRDDGAAATGGEHVWSLAMELGLFHDDAAVATACASRGRQGGLHLPSVAQSR